ncbi:MAG: hypothetical protein DWI68_00090 [Chloroflexi bacterium]|nr:MAG: hypothetical protein DWI68_00090 [Chloroflexota bacterium]
MNESYASQLEAGLAAELAALENFVDLTIQERQVLRREDPVELDRIVRGKARQLADISLIEAQQRERLEQWHPEGAPAGGLRQVSDWLPFLDEQSSTRVGGLRDAIMRHLERVREINFGNRALIEDALQRNTALHDFIARLVANPPTYSAPGLPPALASQSAHLVDLSG